MSSVGEEIHQTKPFATIEEELLVSLLRTTDVLQRALRADHSPLQHLHDAVQRAAHSARS